MDPWTYYALALLLVVAGAACWFSNLFGAPGNWLLVGLALLFATFVPQDGARGIAGRTIWILAALAAVGEVIEFSSGAMGAAKQGASRRAIWYSLVGAIIGSVGGAIVGMPVPVLGPIFAALFGGAAGAFAGAYLGESHRERPHAERIAVSRAAFWGRLWGTLGKFAIGAVMLGVTAVDAFFI